MFVGWWMFWKLSTKLICIVYKNDNFPGRASCCYCYFLSSSVVAQHELCRDKSSWQLGQNREWFTSAMLARWEVGGLCSTNMIITSEVSSMWYGYSTRARLFSLSLKDKLSCLFLCCLLALPDLIYIPPNIESWCLKFSGWGVTMSWNKHYFTCISFSLIYSTSEQSMKEERKKYQWIYSIGQVLSAVEFSRQVMDLIIQLSGFFRKNTSNLKRG